MGKKQLIHQFRVSFQVMHEAAGYHSTTEMGNACWQHTRWYVLAAQATAGRTRDPMTTTRRFR